MNPENNENKEIIDNEKIINQPLTGEKFINKFSGSPELLTNINKKRTKLILFFFSY